MFSLKKYLPNFLTGVRLLITPVIFWLVINQYYYWAVFSILLAATTDILDGKLARKFQVCSSFGYAFDHVVDIIYLSSIIYLVFRYLDFWLFLFVAFLEVGTIIFSLLLNKKGQEKWPNIWGKTSYGFLIGSGCVILIGISTSLTLFLVLGNATLLIVIGLRILSFVSFTKEEN